MTFTMSKFTCPLHWKLRWRLYYIQMAIHVVDNTWFTRITILQTHILPERCLISSSIALFKISIYSNIIFSSTTTNNFGNQSDIACFHSELNWRNLYTRKCPLYKPIHSKRCNDFVWAFNMFKHMYMYIQVIRDISMCPWV